MENIKEINMFCYEASCVHRAFCKWHHQCNVWTEKQMKPKLKLLKNILTCVDYKTPLIHPLKCICNNVPVVYEKKEKYFVRCNNCGCFINEYKTEIAAIKRWNRYIYDKLKKRIIKAKIEYGVYAGHVENQIDGINL